MSSAMIGAGEREQGAPAGGGLIAALALANFVGMLGATSYGPFLPVMAAAFGVGIPLLGQLPAASMLLAAVLGLLVGPLADAHGHRRTLIVGLLAVVVSTLGTGLAPTFAALAVTVLIGAVGRAAILPVALTIAGTRFVGNTRRRAIGVAQAGVSCAPLAGIPLLTTIAAFSEWRAAFVVLALPGVGVTPLVWWTVGQGSAPTIAPHPRQLWAGGKSTKQVTIPCTCRACRGSSLRSVGQALSTIPTIPRNNHHYYAPASKLTRFKLTHY